MLRYIIHIINCISLLFDQASFFGKVTIGVMLLLFFLICYNIQSRWTKRLDFVCTFLSHFQTFSKHLRWLNLSCPDWGNSIDHLIMKKLAKYVCEWECECACECACVNNTSVHDSSGVHMFKRTAELDKVLPHCSLWDKPPLLLKVL